MKGLFLIHLEHQKSIDKEMAFRFLEYLVGIYQLYRKQNPKEPLPIIFPMLVSQSGRSWNVSLSFHEFLEVPEALKPYVPDFRYHLMDLSVLRNHEIRGAIYLQMILTLMKRIDHTNILESSDTLWILFNNLMEIEGGVDYLKEAVRYLSEGSPHLDKEAFIHQSEQQLQSDTAKEVIMTLAEQWKQEGEQRGIQIGEQRGEQKGESRLLKELLQVKFGQTAESYFEILNGLSVKDLETLGKRLITESSLEAIFKGFPSNHS